MTTMNFKLLDPFPKFQFLDGPTGIQPLRQLNKQLGGVELFVKRDDIMGMGLAGNKLRKLEYIIGDALKNNADTLITSGGLQSNHARLTAVAASYSKMDYELVLTEAVANDNPEYKKNGNILLEQILGAKIHYLTKGEDPATFIDNRISSLRKSGKIPYLIPLGGSSPTGCLGYVNCFQEITRQADEFNIHFDYIIVPNGTGGTHAGLFAGLKLSGMKDIRIKSYTVLNHADAAQNQTQEKAGAILNLLKSGLTAERDELVIDGNFLGPGYGIPTNEMKEAVKLLARTEGIFLDPVYTGKAFAGMLADISAGKFRKGDKLLFILTGGLPGLFAYQSAFGPELSPEK
jgi:L-cysteate sulfo-lyase